MVLQLLPSSQQLVSSKAYLYTEAKHWVCEAWWAVQTSIACHHLEELLQLFILCQAGEVPCNFGLGRHGMFSMQNLDRTHLILWADNPENITTDVTRVRL